MFHVFRLHVHWFFKLEFQEMCYCSNPVVTVCSELHLGQIFQHHVSSTTVMWHFMDLKRLTKLFINTAEYREVQVNCFNWLHKYHPHLQNKKPEQIKLQTMGGRHTPNTFLYSYSEIKRKLNTMPTL